MDGTTALAVLGLGPGASATQIKAAFRARAKLLHPDHHGAADSFVTLREAYQRALAHARAAERHRPTGTGTPVRLAAGGRGRLDRSRPCPTGVDGPDRTQGRSIAPAPRRGRWVPLGDEPGHRVDVVDITRPTPTPTPGPGRPVRSFEDHLALALAS